MKSIARATGGNPAPHPPRLRALLSIPGMTADTARWIDAIYEAQRYTPLVCQAGANGCTLDDDEVMVARQLAAVIHQIRKSGS